MMMKVRDESVADVKTNRQRCEPSDRRRSRRRIIRDSGLNGEWTHVVTCKLLLRKKTSEISE